MDKEFINRHGDTCLQGFIILPFRSCLVNTLLLECWLFRQEFTLLLRVEDQNMLFSPNFLNDAIDFKSYQATLEQP
jgi:hypothetical protein